MQVDPNPDTSSWPISVQTHDVDDQAIALHGWSQRYQQLSPGRFNGAVSSAQLSNVEVFFESSNQHMHQVGTPPRGKVVLGLPLHTEGMGWLAGREFDRDSVVAIDAGEEFRFRTPHQLLLGAFVCEKDHLMEAASRLDVEAPIQAALTAGSLHLESAIADELRGLFADVRAWMSSGQLCEESEFTRAAFAESMLNCWLRSFKGVDSLGRSFTHTRRQRRGLAVRAQRYLVEHVSDLPDVAELCRVLQVQDRVLQYCFRDVFGLTPNAFLRNMRLHEVRRAIRADVNQDESIGDIAFRWGFWHLSRFATEYRQLFGERPSDTRRTSCPTG